MKSITLAALTALCLMPVLATSASAHDEIDRRQAAQEQRIQDARRSGELTRREYRQLEDEQARIAEYERRAKADGHLSNSEKRNLREMQNEASRHIYQESHDGQRSWWRRWH